MRTYYVLQQFKQCIENAFNVDKKYQDKATNCIKLKACANRLTTVYFIVYTSGVNKGVFT